MLSKENIALYAFQKFGDTALQAAFCCIGTREDAEDIAQEVFFQLHQNPREFNNDEHLKAWILRCVINRCRDMHKSTWRRMRIAWENVPEHALADDQEDTAVILDAVRALPQPYAEVVYLHDCEGYTLKEIAEMLGKKENTVGAQLRRGHEKLRMALNDPEV
ncbi:MAG: sigma-70 family RNA polymerase sigma factor [Oscillospiraceae bacterium]|nr:sigma-70 family RNA polymerase sigma factor [Oscillospiraceae bacterium]